VATPLLFFQIFGFSDEQRIQALLHLWGETCYNDGVDLRFVGCQPGLDQSSNIIWRFDRTSTTLSANQLTQAFRMLFMRKDFGAKPVQERFFISAPELAHFGYLTDLRSMRLDGSSFPDILSKEGSIHPNLGREKA
jgi:hypothetical protein